MSSAWWLVLLVGVGSMLLKGLGPALLGGYRLPAGIARLVSLLGPSLLSALVVTQTFGQARHLVLDARAAGLFVAGLLAWLRAPVLVVLVTAAGVTALVRTL